MIPVPKIVLWILCIGVGFAAWVGYTTGYRQGHIDGVARCITDFIVDQLPLNEFGPRSK